MVVHHAGQMMQTPFDSGSARHTGHRYISADISHGLEVLLENYRHINKRVGSPGRVGSIMVATYGNDDLGNLKVEDHDLGWCIGISGRHS